MSPSASETPGSFAEARADLNHATRNPLTIISVRSQLLQRAVHQDETLTAAQRTLFLRDLAAINAAVSALVAALDGLDGLDEDCTDSVPEVSGGPTTERQ